MAAQRRILSQPDRFRAQEDGGVTAFGIFTFGLMMLTVGLAIDVTNAYRHKALLQVTADSAAQAGIVALARGQEADELVVDQVEGLPKRIPVVVVSSDAWVREHAERAGAMVISAPTVLDVARQAGRR